MSNKALDLGGNIQELRIGTSPPATGSVLGQALERMANSSAFIEALLTRIIDMRVRLAGPLPPTPAVNAPAPAQYVPEGSLGLLHAQLAALDDQLVALNNHLCALEDLTR